MGHTKFVREEMPAQCAGIAAGIAAGLTAANAITAGSDLALMLATVAL